MKLLFLRYVPHYNRSCNICCTGSILPACVYKIKAFFLDFCICFSCGNIMAHSCIFTISRNRFKAGLQITLLLSSKRFQMIRSLHLRYMCCFRNVLQPVHISGHCHPIPQMSTSYLFYLLLILHSLHKNRRIRCFFFSHVFRQTII